MAQTISLAPININMIFEGSSIPFIIVCAFILGTIIGSFLNVVILRHNSGRTVGGRSMCFSCGKTLHWHELVPVFSYLLQRGKCTKCKSKISPQYPVVEFLTGVIFALLVWKFSFLLLISPLTFLTKTLFYGYLLSLLVVISVYDLKHGIIPDQFSYLFGIMSFLLLFFETGNIIMAHVPTVFQILAGPLIAAPFAFFWWVSKGRWMGFGDAKLAIGMGFLLGVSGGITALMIAFWSGAIVSLILLLLKKYKFTMRSEIPFAPFLVLATCVTFIFSLDFIALLS